MKASMNESLRTRNCGDQLVTPSPRAPAELCRIACALDQALQSLYGDGAFLGLEESGEACLFLNASIIRLRACLSLSSGIISRLRSPIFTSALSTLLKEASSGGVRIAFYFLPRQEEKPLWRSLVAYQVATDTGFLRLVDVKG